MIPNSRTIVFTSGFTYDFPLNRLQPNMTTPTPEAEEQLLSINTPKQAATLPANN